MWSARRGGAVALYDHFIWYAARWAPNTLPSTGRAEQRVEATPTAVEQEQRPEPDGLADDDQGSTAAIEPDVEGLDIASAARRSSSDGPAARSQSARVRTYVPRDENEDRQQMPQERDPLDVHLRSGQIAI